MSAATISARGGTGRGARSAGGVRRFIPAVIDIVETALARVAVEVPELATAAWRDRAAESEHLHAELRRRLELCDLGTGYAEEDITRLRTCFTDMARRGAPAQLVQRRSGRSRRSPSTNCGRLRLPAT